MLDGSTVESAVGSRLLVAAGRADQAAAFESILWFSGLLLVLALAVLVVARIRKRFIRPDDSAGLGLTLDDLRRQRDQGRLTDAEYETLKAAVIDAMRDDRQTGQSSSGKLFQGAGK
jgi:hypothetical protein